MQLISNPLSGDRMWSLGSGLFAEWAVNHQPQAENSPLCLESSGDTTVAVGEQVTKTTRYFDARVMVRRPGLRSEWT